MRNCASWLAHAALRASHAPRNDDCWTSFRDFFEAKGHRVVVPPWPYVDRSVEQLRRTPDPRLAKMTIKGLVDHFEKQIRDLPEQPVLIGHSFGGLIVQMLLDRGLGAAGWQSMPVRRAACCRAPPRLGLRFPSS
jgi:pimeloyl-ACP methyl ester carboxylesterase